MVGLQHSRAHLTSRIVWGSRASSLSPPFPGLAGSDDVENAQIAAVVDAIGDVLREVFKFVFEKDEEKKVQAVYVAVLQFAVVLGSCMLLVPWFRLL